MELDILGLTLSIEKWYGIFFGLCWLFSLIIVGTRMCLEKPVAAPSIHNKYAPLMADYPEPQKKGDGKGSFKTGKGTEVEIVTFADHRQVTPG